MTPLDDLVDATLFTLEESLHGSVASVLDPAGEPKMEGHLLGMLAEEDPLNASLDLHPCPGLLHLRLENTISLTWNQCKVFEK
jgi:hypothetical protein